MRIHARIGICALLASASLAASAAPPRVTVSQDAIVVHLSFPAPTFDAVADGVVPRLPGLLSEAAAPGHPRIPLQTVTLVLPPRTEVTGIAVDGAPREVAGRFRIAWGHEPRPIGQPPIRPTDPDRAIYGSDAIYPESPVSIARHGWFRGYRLVALAVRPVQVRAASGRVLAWSDMELRLGLGPAGASAVPTAPPRGLAADVDAVSKLALNPETCFSYPESLASGEPDRPYLIVTTEALRPAFQRLLDHRRAHGREGSILTMEEVLASHPGRDGSEKLRNAIAEAYRDRGTTFVLLGGDDVDDAGNEIVPVRHCAGMDHMATDWYLAALDGDFDANGNGQFCETDEIDFYAEVHVGRATVDTPQEASRWIDKVLAFEHGLPEERRTDLVFMGENLDSSTWGEDCKEDIANLIPQPSYSIDRLYARAENFSGARVVESLNRGPNMTNHLGHAGSDYVMGIGIGDVEALRNPSPFFSYSQGCYAGAFDQEVSGNNEAISEHFLTAANGAVAVIMNSRYGWYCVGWPFCLSAVLDKDFYNALYGQGLATLGEANDDSRHDSAPTAMTDGTMLYCFLETNLHGDPATPAQLRRNVVRHVAHRVIETELAYGNADGIPDPGETVEIAVTLKNDGADTASGVEAHLTSSMAGVTVRDGWAAWDDLAAGASSENRMHPFTATLDLACGSQASFRLEVRHDGVTDISVFTIPVGNRTDTDVLVDDFETDRGWITGGNASAGKFVRQDPNGTSDATVGPVQAGDDATENGAVCWVTGNPAIPSGGEPRSGDVDGGNTFIRSPIFDGTGPGRLIVQFARWFHRTGVATLNTGYALARVTTDNGSTWTDVERWESNLSAWTRRELDLSAFVTPSTQMALRFEAVEGRRQPGDPLVELLIDDVRAYRRSVACSSSSSPDAKAPNPVGAALRAERHGEDVVLRWTSPPADADHDPARFFPVYRSSSPGGGYAVLHEPTEPTLHDAGAAGATAADAYYLVSARNAAGDSGESPIP